MLIEFGRAVVFAAIEQAPDAQFAKALGHAINGSIVDAQHLGGLAGGATAIEVQNDQIAHTQRGRATLA